jgi:chitinase
MDNEADFTQLSSKVSHLLLSFGRFIETTPGAFKIEYSDNLLKYGYTEPSDLYWLEPEYLKWTQYAKYRADNATAAAPAIKTLLAFGGATYSDIWAYLDNANNIQPIAKALVDLLSVEFPVFDRQGTTGEYSQVGTVQLDGIDFDYEQNDRPSATQMANLASLIAAIKSLKSDAIVSLTGYHVSADPQSCTLSDGPDCSYVGSDHSGELIPLLEDANLTRNLDFYNLMAYDAGKNYKWSIALANHAKYLPLENITLGLSLGTQ